MIFNQKSKNQNQKRQNPTSWSNSTKFDARGQWLAAPARWWRRPEYPWTSSWGRPCSSSSPSWSPVQLCPDLAAAENFQVVGAGDDQVSLKIHRAKCNLLIWGRVSSPPSQVRRQDGFPHVHPVRVNLIQRSTSTCSYLGSSSPLVAGVKVGLRKTPPLSLSILQYNFNYEPPKRM